MKKKIIYKYEYERGYQLQVTGLTQDEAWEMTRIAAERGIGRQEWIRGVLRDAIKQAEEEG